LRRRRYQKGSLQCRKQGKRKVWVLLYYDGNGKRQYRALGLASKLTKGDAEAAQQEFMRGVNGGGPAGRMTRPPLLSEFIDETYLPFYRGKWKDSTKGTTEGRMKTHIRKELGGKQLPTLGTRSLQQWLQTKADSGLSRSVVKHLCWDLRSLFRMALAEGLIPTNPAVALYCPKIPAPSETPSMTAIEVRSAIEVLALRERAIFVLVVFAGMRPGELLALQRGDIVSSGRVAEVRRRVYRASSTFRRMANSERWRYLRKCR
jgi:integrase